MSGLVLAAHGGRFQSQEFTRYKVVIPEKVSCLLPEYRQYFYRYLENHRIRSKCDNKHESETRKGGDADLARRAKRRMFDKDTEGALPYAFF